MSCTQLITPNLDPVIYQNGHALTDWWGWCLAYVQTAFDTGWAGSNATEAWNDHVPANVKHWDSNIPAGMYVPIYFSGYHGLGHFAIYKDGQVWCTPIEHKPYADQWSSIAIVEQKYGVTYVGWCEILGGKQVVEYISDPVITPPPTVHPYTIQSITPKQVRTNKQPTRKWGMNYDNLPAISNNPEGQLNQGTILTVTAICHHQVGYDYYLEDANNPSGYNVADCDDIPSPAPPPPPPPPLPTPVIAPPVSSPSREVYPIKVNIPTYASVTDAQNMRNALNTLSASLVKYYAFNTLNGMVSITTQPGVSQGIWINPVQNMVQPVPSLQTATTADVMKTWNWGYPTHEPAEYKIVRNYIVNDLIHNGHSIDIKAGHNIDIYGSFVMNGTLYLRPLTSVDDKGLYYWYGIPTTDIHTGEPYLLNEFDIVDRAQVKWESIYDRVIRTIEGIFKPKRK